MRVCLAFAALCLLAGCGEPAGSGLRDLFERYYEAYLRENPEAATSLGRTEYNDRWRDWSLPALDAWERTVAGYLAEAEGYDLDRLGPSDRVSLRLLRRELATELEGLRYDAYLLRVNQLFGLHTSVLLVMRQMPARTEADYETMLARLRAVPAYIDGNIGTLREAVRSGVVQPRLVADAVARQLEAQSSPAADEAPLLAAFRAFPAGIPEERRRELAGEAERSYREDFVPAWKRLGRFLADEYAPAARPSLAVTGLDGGDAIYAYFIRYHTSSDLGPSEIHELGLREVERIERAMEGVARDAGFEGTIQEYERHLTTASRYLFESKEQMLSYHRDIAMRVAPELPRFFRELARHRVGIRAIPADREAASASNYNAPAADGSRSGWFNLKAYRPERQSRFDKPALVLHETNPGHHLQIALQLEMEGLPEFRKIYRTTAYIEGWALYAETLGGDLGVYDDPASRFGALASERFRARRLVVDTGLHAMDWTRERAVDYLGKESEVDRYIAWPGQALAYKMGQLKMLELKSAAREAYGGAFDVRDFHDAVLRHGALPLDMLEELVGEYIARAAPASAPE